MQIMKFATLEDQLPHVGVVRGDDVVAVGHGELALTHLLHSGDPAGQIRGLLAGTNPRYPLESVRVLAPLDQHEVWGAGVTYERSKLARSKSQTRRLRFTTWCIAQAALSSSSRRLLAGLLVLVNRSGFDATRIGPFPSPNWRSF